MKLGIIKSLVICTFGAAALAGCASSPSSQSAASGASATSGTSGQGGVKTGRVKSVETVAVVDQSLVGTSSGGSAVVTTASSAGPVAITVMFNDGTESRYIIDNPKVSHAVGETVYVITDRDRTGIMRP